MEFYEKEGVYIRNYVGTVKPVPYIQLNIKTPFL